MKSVTTKTYTTLLLALLAALWSTNAWAAVTVNVKAPSAPHIYAWDANQNKLTTNEYPGDEMADTKTVDGVTYYTITFENETSINLLFTNNGQQTSDFSDITDEVYFNYDGATKAYGKIPSSIAYESGNIAYFVNTKNWDHVYAYVFNGDSNNGWPGEISQLAIATDGANQGVYKFGPFNNFNPTKIIFSNGSGKQTPDLDFTQGGYYVYGEYDNGNSTRADLVATIDASRISNTATYFADKHFREAITKNLGVNEGAAFTPSDVTVLDLSYDANVMTGKISSINTPSGGGIDYFTNLKELYLNDNDLQYLKLTKNSSLEILEMRNNPTIVGFTANASTVETNHAIIMPPSANKPPLKRLDASGCTNLGWFQAINGTYGINTLEWLSLNSCPLDGWSSGITAQTGLKYLDLTNSGQKTSVLTANNLNFPNLKTLILAHNASVTTPVLTNLTSLKTLDVSNCAISSLDITNNTALEYLYASGNATDPSMIIPDNNSLKWVDMSSGNLTYITSFNKLSNLQHLDLHNCAKLNAGLFNQSRVNSTANPALEYLNISQSGNEASSKITTFTDDWASIDTLIVQGENSSVNKIVVSSHMPKVLDVTNNTSLTELVINNCGLTTMPTITATGATSLYKLDLSHNAFTAVPTTGISTLTTLVMNDNQLSDLNVSESNIQYLYAQNNKFGGGEYELLETSLVGLDLGNNRFTKFKMIGNTTLKSLALSGNDALTEIELHRNTQLTQTSPDGVIESDNGLYINNLANLEILNIENSNFNTLGQGDALIGLPKLKKLQARKNKFTTFTNGVYELHTSTTNSVNYRKPDPTQSSLERLEALEYLDLAYNNLQDSVHLYRNTALKHLDVSYNRSIDGQLDPAAEPLAKTAEQKATILEQKGRRWLKYGKVKFNGQEKVYGKNVTPEQWTAHYTNLQAHRMRPFDLRECDLNDTTGLYHLDLHNNVNLEYINFSYTNIHNTAAGPTFMCPGWMNEDWVTDDDLSAANATGKKTDGRWYSSWHTFVYFIPCSKLKVIHADHNNLSGFGVRYFPELDTLTCSYMYGESALMRDVPSSLGNATSYEDLRYWMGNTGLQTSIQKFDHIDWANVENSGKSYGVVLTGPKDNPTGYFPNKIRYYDNSYSSFNEIRFYPGTADNGSLPYLEYVNVSGNPLKCQSHPNSSVSNYNSLDLTYCPNIKTVLANNCDSLPTVRAYNRDALTTLDLTNDPQLKTVYAQDDAMLQSITGLSTLTGLETLFAYNNTQFGGIDVSSNTALKNLWVSNINASSIDVSHNAALEKLRVYDNLLDKLNVTGNTALTWLDVARNQIPSLDLSANAALQYFNCSNSEETLNDLSLTQNNHNGAEGDSEKPASGTAKASNGGNNLSDLVFPGTAIADVRANYNDLHCIKPGTSGSFANLTHIEFAHNHINGIDLSAATGLTPADVIDEDNGRAITAECAKFIKYGTTQEVTVYYFQLDNIRNQQLAGKTSKDSKGTSRVLGRDGFILDNLTAWDGTNAAPYIPATTGISPKDVTIDPSNMADYLGADVEGTVVVLKEDAQHPGEGRATYSYNNGVGNSTFYLDWEANADLPTAINVIEVGDGLSIAGSYGGMTIAGADGTVIGVYDMSGRQVASEAISGGTATITGLTPGIYVVNGHKVVVK